MKGKLFHSFGAAARKAQSPSVVGVTTLAPCRSPLFDLKLYLPLSSILISSKKSYTAKDLQSLHGKP